MNKKLKEILDGIRHINGDGMFEFACYCDGVFTYEYLEKNNGYANAIKPYVIKHELNIIAGGVFMDIEDFGSFFTRDKISFLSYRTFDKNDNQLTAVTYQPIADCSAN